MNSLLLWYARQIPAHRGKWWVVRRLRRWTDDQRLAGEHRERRDGLWWSLDPTDYTCQDLFWCGSKDPWEIHHLLCSAPADPKPCVFFDIGANFGYYSLKLAQQIGLRFQAHIFEPHPFTHARLLRNIEMNNMTNLRPWALGIAETAGVAGFDVKCGNTGSTSLTNEECGEGRVETISLDGFCEREKISQIDLMKIDVEGLEAKVLRGGKETLSRLRPPLLIEISPPSLRAKGSSPEEIRDLLTALGYVLWEIHRSDLRPLRRLPQGEDYINALCLPPR
jgi:FkbM family methyltransferase